MRIDLHEPTPGWWAWTPIDLDARAVLCGCWYADEESGEVRQYVNYAREGEPTPRYRPDATTGRPISRTSRRRVKLVPRHEAEAFLKALGSEAPTETPPCSAPC